MKEKQIKLPGPDHPISIQRNPARVVVSSRAGWLPIPATP